MAERVENRGVHYGWIVLAGSMTVLLAMAEAFYSFGVFVNPLEAEFGWNRATTSSAFTALLLGAAASSFVAGRMGDRYGPRLVLTGVGLLTGAGFVLASQTGNIWHLRLSLALAGAGAGATWSIPLATVSRWFIKRRGLALGLTTSGLGVGPLIFVPLTNYFVESFGWRTAYLLVGLICLGLTVSASQLLVHAPEKKGLKPYGAEDADALTTTSVIVAPPSGEMDLAQAVRTPAFVGLATTMVLISLPMQLIIVHLVPFATGVGITAALAASALGLEGVFSLPGRIVLGMVCDRIGWQRGLALTNIGLGATCVFLIAVRNYPLLFLFVLFFGLFHGGRNPPMLGIQSYLFGTRALGGVIGLTWALSLLGGAAGPYLAGFIFDRTGSYSLAFLVAALLFALGGGLALVVKPPHRTRAKGV